MEELIQQFGLDWKLLAAQVVNFLILLYVLKRFAYQPILNILRKRKEEIEAGLKASEESKQKLAEAHAMKEEIVLDAKEEAVKIISRAEDSADEQVQIVLKAAHEKSEQIIAHGQKKLQEDERKLWSEVTDSAEVLIKKGLAATIGKMNPSERDETLIKEALKELKTMQ